MKQETVEEAGMRQLALIEASSIVMHGRYVATYPARTGGWQVIRWRSDAGMYEIVENPDALDGLVRFRFSEEGAQAMAKKIAEEVGR